MAAGVVVVIVVVVVASRLAWLRDLWKRKR